MNISKIKLAVKFITGGKTGVVDYVLDVANNAVNALDGATKEKIATVLAAAKNILGTMRSVKWLVPTKWINSYNLTIVAFADVVSACEDLALTTDEISTTADAFKIAYAEWMAD